MEYIVLTLVIIIGAAVAFLIIRQSQAPRSEDLRRELQLLLQESGQNQLQTILQQLNQQQSNTQESSTQLHNRISENSKALHDLQSKFAVVEESSRRIVDMNRGITELQNILQAPKLRGERGEMWLEELLSQMIPRSNFHIQYHFKSGEICDAVIILRDNMLLPIDSKFSLENFRKMISTEDEAEKKAHEKVFISDIKKRIDEISRKYILPGEGTLGFAFMYIPAENVYYQAFVEDRSNNGLQRYAFDKHVIPVSPNSLYPYLEIVLFGLKGLEIEKDAQEIQRGLVGLQKEIGKFEEDYRKVGTHLRNAQGSFESSDKRLAGVHNKLEHISEKELPSSIERIIEP